MTTYVLGGRVSEEVAAISVMPGVRAIFDRYPLYGALFDPDDKILLVGTWWRRPNFREEIERIWYVAMRSRPDRIPKQIVELLEPLMKAWAEK